jgi:hypothetical protein
VASELEAAFTIDFADASESSLVDALTALRNALEAKGVETEGPISRQEVVSTRNLAMA